MFFLSLFSRFCNEGMGTPAEATLALVLSAVTEMKYHRRTHESSGYERYTLEAPGVC